MKRIDSLSAYQQLLKEKEEEKAKRLAQLKAIYGKNGWEWKW